MSGSIRVVHLITSLNRGGAEMSLGRLLNHDHDSYKDLWVVALIGSGGLSAEILAANVKVFQLRLDSPLGVARFFRFLWSFVIEQRHSNATVLVCWMYHSCVLGMFFKILALGRLRLIWNVRQCLGDVANESRSSRVCLALMRCFYGVCDSLVSNSETALRQHVEFGIDCSRCHVIPNGYPPVNAVSEPKLLREVCEIPTCSLVIGHLARFHPIKDHATFCKALNLVFEQVDFAEAILVGKNVLTAKSLLLTEVAPEYVERIHFQDEIEDSSWGFESFDIFCLTSLSEAFPNVLAEAMSHALPCVATDVGEVRNLSAKGCFIVPPADAEAIAKELVQLARLPETARVKLGIMNRKKIEENFSISFVVQSYQNLFKHLVVPECVE